MVTKSDLATQVSQRVDGIPAAVTSSVIEDYIEYSHIEVENLTGDGFATTDIPTKYQPILIDMGTVKTIEYMITHGISSGGLSVSSGDLERKRNEIQKRVDRSISNLIRTKGSMFTTEPQENG